MIRHVALITFNDWVTDGDIAEIEDALASLRPMIPQIATYAFGADLGLDGANADFVIIGDFASVEDYQTYAAHPEHVRVLTTVIKPRAATVGRIQLTLRK